MKTKTLIRMSMLLLFAGVAATMVYFFLSGTLLIAVSSLLLSVMCGILIWEMHRREREENQPKEKGYFYFFIFMGIFNLIGAVVQLIFFPELAILRL